MKVHQAIRRNPYAKFLYWNSESATEVASAINKFEFLRTQVEPRATLDGKGEEVIRVNNIYDGHVEYLYKGQYLVIGGLSFEVLNKHFFDQMYKDCDVIDVEFPDGTTESIPLMENTDG